MILVNDLYMNTVSSIRPFIYFCVHTKKMNLKIKEKLFDYDFKVPSYLIIDKCLKSNHHYQNLDVYVLKYLFEIDIFTTCRFLEVFIFENFKPDFIFQFLLFILEKKTIVQFVDEVLSFYSFKSLIENIRNEINVIHRLNKFDIAKSNIQVFNMQIYLTEHEDYETCKILLKFLHHFKLGYQNENDSYYLSILNNNYLLVFKENWEDEIFLSILKSSFNEILETKNQNQTYFIIMSIFQVILNNNIEKNQDLINAVLNYFSNYEFLSVFLRQTIKKFTC